MLEEAKDVERDHVENEVAILHRLGYRFVTMTCLDAGGDHEILYHFDKQYRMRSLRLHLPKGTPLPSISALYFAANLIENEIKDMFGIVVEGLGIDFQGRFLLAEDAPRTPLNKNCGMKVDIRVRQPAATAATSERSDPV